MGTIVTHIDKLGNQPETRILQIAEESEWILAAKKDLNAFEPLYKRYYKPIYEFIYRRCDDSEACVDITAITFEKAMINIGKFKLQGFPFGSWLYRIAASEIGNYYRKEIKDRKVYVQTDGIRDIAEEFESKLADEENIQTLLRAMETLKPEDLELVVMRYFEKRSFTDIAGFIDTNESNARVRLHRVLLKLKDAFFRETNA